MMAHPVPLIRSANTERMLLLAPLSLAQDNGLDLVRSCRFQASWGTVS